MTKEEELALKQMFGGKKSIAMGGAIPKIATIYNTSLPELRAEVSMLCKGLPYKHFGDVTFKEHAITGEVLYFQELEYVVKDNNE